jgi:hypothetical protein
MATLGYGDVVPVTVLGRVINVIGAISGVFLNSLLFALAFEKIQHTTRESRVVGLFEADVKRARKKELAAAVVQAAWRNRGSKGSLLALRAAARKWVHYKREMRRSETLTFAVQVETMLFQTSALLNEVLEVEQRLNRVCDRVKAVEASGVDVEEVTEIDDTTTLKATLTKLVGRIDRAMARLDRAQDTLLPRLRASQDGLAQKIQSLTQRLENEK